MNFGAHIVVAHRPGTGTAHLLGAAAPDLVRMARVPLAPDLAPELAAGVRDHHRADAAFHDSAWFRRRNRAVTGELLARGVRRGPARAAGHVIVELLLDGAVLADGGHRDVFAEAWAALGRPDPTALALAAPERRDDWTTFLRELTSRLDPYEYRDPGYAADRVAGTLQRRPRLALDAAEHDVLRGLAAAWADEIAGEAPSVVAEVVGRLRA